MSLVLLFILGFVVTGLVRKVLWVRATRRAYRRLWAGREAFEAQDEDRR